MSKQRNHVPRDWWDRDSLTSPQQAAREACIQNCHQALADGWAELWDQVRLHGVQATAERVFYPGAPAREPRGHRRVDRERAGRGGPAHPPACPRRTLAEAAKG